jgi:hypothetical protein
LETPQSASVGRNARVTLRGETGVSGRARAAFIQNAQTTNVPQFLPQIEPYILDTDISWKGVVTQNSPAGAGKYFEALAEIAEALR